MSRLFVKLRMATYENKQYVSFRCPGCDDAHTINIGGDGWHWNGDAEKPTFSPSVLVTRPANPNAGPGFEEYRTELRCHSFVKDGQIQFLDDCLHALKGQTVELPNFED